MAGILRNGLDRCGIGAYSAEGRIKETGMKRRSAGKCIAAIMLSSLLAFTACGPGGEGGNGSGPGEAGTAEEENSGEAEECRGCV